MAFGNKSIVHNDTSDTVVFVLKSDKGETLKTYKVPITSSASFEAELKKEAQDLSDESRAVHVVKVEKIV